MAQQAQVGGEHGLLIADAVAVGVLIAEGHQGVDELVDGGGHGQLQLVQPVLTDAHGIGARPALDVEGAGQQALQHPEGAVRAGAGVADGGVFTVGGQEARRGAVAVLQHGVHAGEHAALDQVVQLGSIQLQEHDVRQVDAGGQAGGLGGLILVGLDVVQLQVDAQFAGLLHQPGIGRGILEVAHAGAALIVAEHGDGGQLFLRRHGERAHGERHGQRQNQRQNSTKMLHECGSSLFCYS